MRENRAKTLDTKPVPMASVLRCVTEQNGNAIITRKCGGVPLREFQRGSALTRREEEIMNNFDAYVTNIVYGLILLAGYSFLGIIPTILGFLTWFVIDKLLESRFESEKKAETAALVAGILVAVVSALILKRVMFGG